MRCAVYARVSTNDRDQNPETQLVALRDFARAQGWTITREYVDHAPANDLRGRVQWRRLVDDAARRRFDTVLVFKLDRAFRSVKHMHDTLAAWQMVDVAFASAREGFDTSTAIGRLLMNLLASLAEFELEVLSERVRAGMERARREGKKIGRPKVVDREEVRQMLPEVQARIEAGEISRNQAAKMLGIGKATLLRLLDGPKTGSG